MIGARNMVWADVVIIGSGVAGAMTAYRLAKAGIKVVILEAGPRIDRAEIVQNFMQSHNLDLSSGFPHEEWAPRPDWGKPDGGYIEYMGDEVPKVEYLKVVGGTTWHWAGVSIRLTPAEMKMKTTYDLAVDWPISYDDLEPFYCEAEYEMGVAGDNETTDDCPRSRPFPMPMIPHSYSEKIVLNSAKNIGIDFIPRPVARNSINYDGRIRCQGFGTCSPICPSGAQYNASVHVHKAEALGAKLFENTRVDKIFTDKQGNIKDVLAVTKDGTELTVRGKIFVMAANGIESPKLLLMSADEHRPDGIGNSSGLVGKYYFDHPGVYCRIVMPEPVYPRGPESTMTSHTFRDGDFRKTHAGWTMAVYNRPHLDDVARELLEKNLEPPALDRELRKRISRQLEIDTHMDQLPNIKNAIRLNWDKRDSAGHPRIKMYYSYSDYEKIAFTRSRRIFKKLAKTLDAEIVKMSDPFAHHHLMGTTRMGDDPKTSVVDTQCRSHDHKNLFVISSSVFPTGGAANPTLTIAALALRAGDEIARQLKKGQN